MIELTHRDLINTAKAVASLDLLSGERGQP